MRIVIDMQGAQAESRYRGIGRYSLALAEAIARNKSNSQIILALNGSFPETIQEIRTTFAELVEREDIRVFDIPRPTRECDPSNSFRRQAAELMREAAIAAMRPDVVLVTSLFEGFGDDAVASVGKFDCKTPTAAILYDLIPLISPDENFRTNPIYSEYYARKVVSLKNCHALLAISASARQEAIDALGYSPDGVVNISAGCDPRFVPTMMTESERRSLFEKLGVLRPYIMYTGGADERKNLERLFQAFAALPGTLRKSHQVLIAGKMPDVSISSLKSAAKRADLRDDEVVFSGYVSDGELMQLYSGARLFVFPSLHEGFGLPPLEAMGCGAPVITSNASSLPEVVGRADALFDPESVPNIAAKIVEVLTNSDFRSDLIRYGQERVKKFSWDDSAKKAIGSLEKIAQPSCIEIAAEDGESPVKLTRTGIFKERRLRILVSKLDHRGDLILALPAIGRLRARYPHARIDALIGSWNKDLARGLNIFEEIYTLDVFSDKSSEAPRDSGAVSSVLRALPAYDIAIDLRRPPDTRFVLSQVGANLRVGYATGDPSIDDRLHEVLKSPRDLPFVSTECNQTSIALQLLRLVEALPPDPSDYVAPITPAYCCSQDSTGVAIFPTAGNSIKEWGVQNFIKLVSLLNEAGGPRKIGIFVGREDEAKPFRNLTSPQLSVHCGLNPHELQKVLSTYSVCVANNSFGAHLAGWLGLRVIGIFGGHETVEEWGPVFGDCRILSVEVSCSPCHLPRPEDCPYDLKCLKGISPERVVSAIQDAECGVERTTTIELRNNLIEKIAPITSHLSAEECLRLSEAIALNIPTRAKKRLFLDISELVQHDAKSGIQRVVRSMLKYMLSADLDDYEVVPVYATPDRKGYQVARRFAARFNHRNDDADLEDEPMDWQSGDTFLGLDLAPLTVISQADFLTNLRNYGVRVVFVVYDILCVRIPQYFDQELVRVFGIWLRFVAGCDGVLCISRAVRDDVLSWFREQNLAKCPWFRAEWFHLGADLESSVPSRGLPDDAGSVLSRLRDTTAFLMVGTVEPRKGHGVALDAFELLWERGQNVLLVIVGKNGWKADELCERMSNHPESGSRLFWLQEISDEYLEKVYASSTCLLAPSFGEGFGLPLIEAAHHGIPVIARDIAVFREVAGEQAYYFQDDSAQALADYLIDWVKLLPVADLSKKLSAKNTSWAESARSLLQSIASDSTIITH
jgi:glycosyltransferase involved in cell wall biosynthesis/ADP-heptose:LPS heptosyltransferase